MTWHIVEGEAGCALAVERRATAIVVDALRASATAAMLLDAGATEIFAVRTVEEALAEKDRDPAALVYGERGGLPPEGFDYGNSPREAAPAAGKRVIFTTTTGTARLVGCTGAPRVYCGTTINALATVQAAMGTAGDVVVIPAGKEGDPDFDAQEDWAAAVYLAMLAGQEVGEGALLFRDWRQKIELDGMERIFRECPHGQRLIELGLEGDVTFCAAANRVTVVPMVDETMTSGVMLRNAS